MGDNLHPFRSDTSLQNGRRRTEKFPLSNPMGRERNEVQRMPAWSTSFRPPDNRPSVNSVPFIDNVNFVNPEYGKYGPSQINPSGVPSLPRSWDNDRHDGGRTSNPLDMTTLPRSPAFFQHPGHNSESPVPDNRPAHNYLPTSPFVSLGQNSTKNDSFQSNRAPEATA